MHSPAKQTRARLSASQDNIETYAAEQLGGIDSSADSHVERLPQFDSPLDYVVLLHAQASMRAAIVAPRPSEEVRSCEMRANTQAHPSTLLTAVRCTRQTGSRNARRLSSQKVGHSVRLSEVTVLWQRAPQQLQYDGAASHHPSLTIPVITPVRRAASLLLRCAQYGELESDTDLRGGTRRFAHTALSPEAVCAHAHVLNVPVQ